MADTVENVLLENDAYQDIYFLSGISPGVPVSIQNTGSSDLYYAIAPSQPERDSNKYRIMQRGVIADFTDGDQQIWFRSPHQSGEINIKQLVSVVVGKTSGFGELLVAAPTPISQITAQYGLTKSVQVSEENGGTVTEVDSNFVVSSGSDPNGIAFVTAIRLAKYRAGETLRCRLTALFDQGNAGNLQLAGLLTSENAVGFGYSGETFGIIRAFDGNTEVQRLTISTAGVGAATVTVNGIAYPVTLTAGTTAHNAWEIADQLMGVVPSYRITSNNNIVVAASIIPLAAGAFAFTGGGAAVASWAQLVQGVSPTFDLIPQDQWNLDTAPWLDPSLGNVYEIDVEYLGYGAIDFAVEEPNSGRFLPVHRIRYANTSQVPSFSNPVFRVGWVSRNGGNTTPTVVRGASAGVFVDGLVRRSGPQFSISANVATVNITPITVILIRSRWYFNGALNRIEVFPLLLSASSQNAKGTFFRILRNPELTDEVNWQYIDETNSVVEYATENVTITGGDSLGQITAEAGDGKIVQFNQGGDVTTVLQPGDVLAIVAQDAQAPASPAQVSLTWQEDY